MGLAGPAARATLIGAICATGCIHGQRSSSRTAPPPPAAIAEALPVAPPVVVHRVRAGETLWRIAKAYGVEPDVLARANHIDDPTQISLGADLVIPQASGAPQARLVPADERLHRRANPTQIPRAGSRPLDPAAGGTPLAWPVPGVLISGFGARDRDQHEGIDLAAPEGTSVRAAADGIVVFAGEQRGYGKLVLLAHGRDLVTVYAHNSQNLVAPGERVAQGDLIARVGRTGNATGPHLHFEVRLGTRPRDPLSFLQ